MCLQTDKRSYVPVICPEMGEGISSVTVAGWHVKVNDYVQAGEDLAEMLTDKAIFNIAAPVNGFVKEILYQAEQVVTIGAVIAHIEPQEPER